MEPSGAFLWNDPEKGSMIQDHLDHGASKESFPRVDSSVPLMRSDSSDLGSKILLRIIPKKRIL